MGNFYANYTLRGPSPQMVAAALAGHAAVVTPPENGCVVVFAEEAEQDPEVFVDLAVRLARELDCPVLAVLNHDDDVLAYHLCLGGDLVDGYVSTPGYFDPSAEHSDPEGGDARRLCEAFEAGDVAAVEKILRRSPFGADGYALAVERHADLARTLGISSFAVGAGYAYVSRGELPEGLDEQALIRVT